jgi:hypothetical protein
MQSVDISDITNLEAPKAQEAVNNLSNINLEVSKRRFINGLIQGAGINSLTMFHMVGDELNSLDPDLLNMYGLLAALIEYGYWVTSPNIGAMSLSNAAAGGKVQLDLKNEEPKIIAQSMTFPILVQELVKGVMELMSAGGLPEDSNTRDSVLSQADSLQDESWDIRFGPEIWKKLVSSLSVNDLNNRALSILYRNTVELDSATFSDFMHDILSKKPEALQKWNNMYQSALTQVNNSKTSSIRGHVLDIYSKYDEYHKNQLNTGKTPELFHIWINKVK